MTTEQQLGELLRSRREECGLTQAGAGLAVGCSRWTIARIEAGATLTVAHGIIAAYAKAMGVELTPAPTG